MAAANIKKMRNGTFLSENLYTLKATNYCGFSLSLGPGPISNIRDLILNLSMNFISGGLSKASSCCRLLDN
jgi:hypothetical protein